MSGLAMIRIRVRLSRLATDTIDRAQASECRHPGELVQTADAQFSASPTNADAHSSIEPRCRRFAARNSLPTPPSSAVYPNHRCAGRLTFAELR